MFTLINQETSSGRTWFQSLRKHLFGLSVACAVVPMTWAEPPTKGQTSRAVQPTQYTLPGNSSEFRAPASLGQGLPGQPVYTIEPQVRPGGPAAIQPVQNTSDSARSLHHLIHSMPSSQEEMDIIERRSQLVVTRSNVMRAAIADPSVLDIVQYSPKEFSIIGLARGSTTLTLWFEDVPDPLIYLIRVVRDPNLEYQRKLDYDRLEKRLTQLFPNSKVYLIPLSRKIIVRGQARDQEEATHILNLIRGEVINQEFGGFGGNGGLGPGGYAGGYGGYGGYGGGDFGGYGGGGGGYGGFGGGFGNGGFGQFDPLNSFIVNELRVPGEYQVALRVRIAELNRSELNRIGVDLNVLFANGRNAISSTLAGVGTGTGGGGTLQGTFDNGNVATGLDLLKANGIAKILSEPTLTVISGQQARFLAGGEFAVPTVVGVSGAAGQTTTFRGFGTSVLITPTVVDRDMIRMSIVSEYSDLNAGISVGGTPGTNTRRIQTTVEMREGQTMALAGLLSHRMRSEISRIPWLGDIPKVGPMVFSAKRNTQDENELLILVTPELVRPMDPHEVPPVPGFEVTKPQDHEFYWYNRIEGNPDTGHYQLPPYGSGSIGTNVGYQHFNPGPAQVPYPPQPSGGNGMAYPQINQPAPPLNQMQTIPMGARQQPGASARVQPQADPQMRANLSRPGTSSTAAGTGVSRPRGTIAPTGYQTVPQQGTSPTNRTNNGYRQ